MQRTYFLAMNYQNNIACPLRNNINLRVLQVYSFTITIAKHTFLVLCLSLDHLASCAVLFFHHRFCSNVFSLKQGSQYATHFSAVHLLLASLSSNVEYLLQIGIWHLRQVYFVLEKHEPHISSLTSIISSSSRRLWEWLIHAPVRMLSEVSCLRNTL